MSIEATKKPRRVEELERYGKSLSDIPKDVWRGQGKIIFRAFRRKLGVLGLVPFAIRVLIERRRLLRDYRTQLDRLRELAPGSASEALMLIAMFKAGDRDYHVQEIEEDENHLRIIVDTCLNVENGRMFDCPEIAKLGCDHDLASYPHIEPQVAAEARRPCTLAKGGSHCEFNFYRRGFAPEGPFVNK